jgi:protein-disulfide isomerase/type II secretory pathway component PulC
MAVQPAGAFALLSWLLLLVAVLPGCSRDDRPERSPDHPTLVPTQRSGDVAAMIGDRLVTSAEVDASIAGLLHELDYQRYQLRREALESRLLRQLTAGDSGVRSARILLTPPVAPAVRLSGAPAAVRPQADAPVTITVFCDFESPHCAVAQASLADLLQLYPRLVRVAARDLPLPIHPRAGAAAEAARCAGAQGRYWQYHDLLFARGAVPDRTGLEAVAAAASLDAAAFRECLDSRAQAAAVAADASVAQALGLSMVPALFVNGRRATPPVGLDQLIWMVESELAVEGRQPTTFEMRGETNLPLSLRATIVGATPGLGLAVIGALRGASGEVVIREGEQPAPGAILRRVLEDRVELLVDGGIETLRFAPVSAGTGPVADDTRDAQESPPGPEQSLSTAWRGPTPVPVFLDREVVRKRMADRVALSTQLKPEPLTVDGYRLLKLENVQPGSLYELLGLQPGDVVVMVNEQPVHEGDNPLWDALDRDSEVRVRVIHRGGIAQQYVYRFQ